MDLLKVAFISLGSLFLLFILTKLSGNKHISQLTMFDYIVSISVGSIAAEMATELENPEHSVIAMVIYIGISILINFFTQKSIKARRILFGHSVVLMSGGKLYRKNLKKAHIDLNEFLMQARSNGYFDLTAINTAVFEPSGRISFMPFSAKRPATPEDLKIVPTAEDIFLNVIMDGRILYNNLKAAGRDENWLNNELKSQGCKHIEDVFLASLDRNGTLNIFKNYDEKIENDYFE